MIAAGFVGIAANVGGDNNSVLAGDSDDVALNLAFNVFGSGNKVQATPGPFAIAGSIGQTGQTITKAGPGFNINNGIVVGGAAAIRNARTAAPTARAIRNSRTAAPTATALHTGNNTAAPAASGRSGTKRTASPAASVGHKR